MNLDLFLKVRILLSADGIGTSRILNLYSRFKDFKSIFQAGFDELSRTEGIGDHYANIILRITHDESAFTDKLSKEYEKLYNLGFGIISFWDKEYPSILKKIYNPPLILYTFGELRQEDTNSIAIVGTRNPTTYGKVYAEKFSKELVENNLTIVSGMARGIDSTAHSAALQKNGRTIAVIGSGLDVIYPPENKNLFLAISKNGAVLSEYPLGTKPDAINFPKRNRIISGLSLGTLVIETGLNGGAIQTARFALEQNREVFALPGNITSKQSEGTNHLIKRSMAKLITKTEDILEELQLRLSFKGIVENKNIYTELTVFEEKIYSQLTSEPIHIDKISDLSNISTSECSVHLLQLELKGIIKQLPGKHFAKI